MSILDELKKLILARHGSVAGVHSIADAVKVLGVLAEAETVGAQTIADGVRAIHRHETGADVENVLKDLEVTGSFTATTEQLLGKALTDLQTNVEVDMTTCKVTGNLKYVTGYTGFSGIEEEQSGNYIAIHVDVEDVTGVTYTSTFNGRTVTFDSDQILIVRVNGKTHIPLIISAAKNGYETVVRTFDLTGLTLASA